MTTEGSARTQKALNKLTKNDLKWLLTLPRSECETVVTLLDFLDAAKDSDVVIEVLGGRLILLEQDEVLLAEGLGDDRLGRSGGRARQPARHQPRDAGTALTEALARGRVEPGAVGERDVRALEIGGVQLRDVDRRREHGAAG